MVMKRHCDQCNVTPQEQGDDTDVAEQDWVEITRGVGRNEIESFEYCGKDCAKLGLDEL